MVLVSPGGDRGEEGVVNFIKSLGVVKINAVRVQSSAPPRQDIIYM